MPRPELSGVVCSDDFTYHEILGCGGFGFVVKVIKKSTGASYAMKIQNKVSLLTTAKDLETKKVRMGGNLWGDLRSRAKSYLSFSLSHQHLDVFRPSGPEP